MQQFSSIYCLTIVLIAMTLTQSEAKRGCSLYGHSCYGGHGKRSDPPRNDLVPMDASQQLNGEKFANINKEVFYPMNNELNGINQLELNNDNRWKSKNELNYALYNLLRRWIDEARKNTEDTMQTSESDTIFKNTFV